MILNTCLRLSLMTIYCQTDTRARAHACTHTGLTTIHLVILISPAKLLCLYLDVLSGANQGNQSRDVIISSCSLPLIVDESPVWEIPHGRDHESTDEADWLPAGQGWEYSTQEEMGKNWRLHLVWFLFIAFVWGRVPLWIACRHLFLRRLVLCCL